MYPGVPGCARVYPGVPGCTRVYPGVPGCTQVYLAVSGCTRVYRLYPDVPRCTQVHPGVPGCAPVNPGVPRCAGVTDSRFFIGENLFGCGAKLNSGVGGCSWSLQFHNRQTIFEPWNKDELRPAIPSDSVTDSRFSFGENLFGCGVKFYSGVGGCGWSLRFHDKQTIFEPWNKDELRPAIRSRTPVFHLGNFIRVWDQILFGCGWVWLVASPGKETGVRDTDSRFFIGVNLFGCGFSLPP